ncbi:hypothetical protein FH609_028040 [Streptomyces sp. 3MP-14]|uniref:LPXTG cell wall anchor domain-containing protein n=1 Tax=Streptomyces mimosae TaxID=2586635 RepID=A0A5N5ZX32_9ACTN|nr:MULTISPECIES: choice-of-anchor M domain-containing protein [Streptomyces]KAB8160286.1 hypothetical protein FH607_027125 [Streptomyces mimosae]KAB8172952.1 hypothetical protein FH609_028040 [Streptomyces sp. 3MP-14]
MSLRTRRGRRVPLRVGVLAAGGLLLAATPAPAAAEDDTDRERAVLDGGHLDLAVRIDENGAWDFLIKDGTVPGQEVWREPNDVILHFDAQHAWQILESAAGRVPERLGRPGETIWVDHSVTYAPGLLWPGWNTEGVPPEAVNSPITAAFTGVEGPEGFFLGQWRDDAELGTVVGIDIDGTLPEPGAVELRPGVHAHPLWFFTEEGVYRLRLELSATLPTGERVADAGTLTAVVGDDIDPDDVELPAPEEPEEPGQPGDPNDPGDPGGSGGSGGESGGSDGPGQPGESGGSGGSGDSDGSGAPGGSGDPGGSGASGGSGDQGGTGGQEGPGGAGEPERSGPTGEFDGSGAPGDPGGGTAEGATDRRPGELAATGGGLGPALVPLAAGGLLAASAGAALLLHSRRRRGANAAAG